GVDVGQRRRLLGGFHEDDFPGFKLAHGPDHFGMALVADQQDAPLALVVTLDGGVHLLHERARGVHRDQLAVFGILVYGGGHAVGAENRDGSGRNFVQLLHENGALVAETLHHELVVHDFMTDVDGGAELLQRLFHDADGALHARAKTAGGGEVNLHAHKVPITEK